MAYMPGLDRKYVEHAAETVVHEARDDWSDVEEQFRTYIRVEDSKH